MKAESLNTPARARAALAYIAELEVALVWASAILAESLQPEDTFYTVWRQLSDRLEKQQQIYTKALEEEKP